MTRAFFLILILAGAGLPALSETLPVPTRTGLGLSPDQWNEAVGQFERSLSVLTKDLERLQAEKARSQKEIEGLQDQVQGIRRKNANGGGVLEDLRLKSLLSDLKDRLEKDSALQKRWAEARNSLEQKTLSLISLYTDRIQNELEGRPDGTAGRDPRTETLPRLIRKRHEFQELLNRYQVKKEGILPIDTAALRSLQKDDPSSLQMTLDLLKDRQKALEEEIEKLRIEADGLREEMKLQSKMRDFMDGLKRMSRDSDAPVEFGKRNELSRVYGPSQRRRLDLRLSELEGSLKRDEVEKEENERSMAKVQDRLRSLGERIRR